MLAAGDLVSVRVTKVATDKVEVALEQDPKAEAALVSIDPRNRAVTALVGGFDHERSPFNRATQARRQPGSAFKPFVYAAALEAGDERAHLPLDVADEVRSRCVVFHPRQTVYDSPEIIRDQWTGKPWQPRNFEKDLFEGPLTMRQALAASKNTVAVKLIGEIGCDPYVALATEQAYSAGLAKVKAMARAAGIDSTIPDSITAALGSGEVVPLEMVNAYATFAMYGRYAAPLLVRRVVDSSGNTVFENQTVFEQPLPPDPDGGLPQEPPPRGVRADLAFVTSQLMRAVIEDPNGTARSLASLGRPIAGKTGTANDHRDAWFVGFTPELVAGVWVGFDDHEMLGGRETGGHAAGPIWLRFMKSAEEMLPQQEWVAPPGVVTVSLDPRTNLLASETTEAPEVEVFLQGTEPTEVAPPPDETSPEDFLRGEGP